MPTMRGYARCSTNEEKQDLERQVRELTALGAGIIYREYVRGASEEKPEQARLLAALDFGDTIIATEVSRLARNVHQLCHLEEAARAKQAKIKCGALFIDYGAEKIDPMNRAMLYMMGTFAELERGVTVERIKSGLENAKAKGVKCGRKKKTAQDVPQAVKDLAPLFERGEITAAELAKRAGVSRQVAYKYFALLGIGAKENRKKTAECLSKEIRDIYARHKSGEITVVEFARLAGVSERTAYSYKSLLDAENKTE
jgi:DNA invertase Pin-like site-specific DNA recombinase